MRKCDICGTEMESKEFTTINPSRYLGDTYPDNTSFCPICFRKFLEKAKEIHDEEIETKKENLQNFINS